MLYIYLPPQVDFKISQLAVSGLRVNRLDLYGEVRAERYTMARGLRLFCTDKPHIEIVFCTLTYILHTHTGLIPRPLTDFISQL